MWTKTRTPARESVLTVVAVLAAAGCSHYWERPGGVVADFEREGAACVEDAKQSPYGPDSLEAIYRSLKPPSPMSGKRYFQEIRRASARVSHR